MFGTIRVLEDQESGTKSTKGRQLQEKRGLSQKIDLRRSNYTDRITRIIASTGLAEPGRPEFQVVVPPRLAGG